MKDWKDYSVEYENYYERMGFIFGELDDLENDLLETNRSLLEKIQSTKPNDNIIDEYYGYTTGEIERITENVYQTVSGSGYSIDNGRRVMSKLKSLFRIAKALENL